MNKLLVAMMAALCVLLVGCNTVSGMGKDIQQGGAAMENAADRHK